MKRRRWAALALGVAAASFNSGCRSCEREPTKAGPPTSTIELAVTVDDLPVRIAETPEALAEEQEVVKGFLSAFAKHRVPAVYGFVNGKRVDETPERFPLLEAWRDAGHRLGNHTYAHGKLSNSAAYIADIDRGEEVLRKLYGDADPQTWKMFRYPFLSEGSGEKREAVRAHLTERGYRIAPVSVDFFDYAYADAYTRCRAANDQAALEKIESSFVERAVECLRGSDTATQKEAGRPVKQVLLIHVGALQARLLDRLLTKLEGAHAKFISLDEALKDPFLQTHSKPGGESRRLCSHRAIPHIKKLCQPPKPSEPADEPSDG